MSAVDATLPVSHTDPIEPDGSAPSVQARRAERELFFWTAWQVLKLVLFSALVVHVIVALVEGRAPAANLLSMCIRCIS
jgi:hypothetical protein